MKNNLYLVKKNVHLTLTWVLTGDARNPLICIWVETGTPGTVVAAPADSEAGRLHLCA